MNGLLLTSIGMNCASVKRFCKSFQQQNGLQNRFTKVQIVPVSSMYPGNSKHEKNENCYVFVIHKRTAS